MLRHEWLEAMQLGPGLVLMAGAVWAFMRGARPANVWLASWLGIAGVMELLQWGDIFPPTWVRFAASAGGLALLVLFVGHVPERRRWMPREPLGVAILAGAIAVAAYIILWVGRIEAWGPHDTSLPMWVYLPTLLLREVPVPVVALLFMWDALRRRLGHPRAPLVWMGLAFAMIAAVLVLQLRWTIAFRVRRAEMSAGGMEVPSWLWSFETLQLVASIAALVPLVVALCLAVVGLLRHRADMVPFGAFVVATLAAASLGLYVGGLPFAGSTTTLEWWLLPVRALGPLGVGLLAPWALAQLRVDEVPIEIEGPSSEPSARESVASPSEQERAYGDAERFHPRLGLDDRD